MITFWAINISITIILALIFSVWRESVLPIVVPLGLMNLFFGYIMFANIVPVETREEKIPISQFETVLGNDRVFLVQNGKTVREFSDAYIVNDLHKFKNIYVNKSYCAYNYELVEKRTYLFERFEKNEK